MSTAMEAALAAHGAGLCVLPPKQNGSKSPDAESWAVYQDRRPTDDELLTWYANGRTGVGLVCGQVSGGLEMLELEGRAVTDGTSATFLRRATDSGLGPLLERIRTGYQERTPSGGIHLLYRCPTPLGNQKLARRQATADELAEKPTDKVRVLIETRGEGGYVVVAPSDGTVHPTGAAWVLEAGGFASIATITDAERDQLWDLARTFDSMPPVEPRASSRAGAPRDSDGPIARYNALPDAEPRTEELLVQHGWTVTHRGGHVAFLRRPGKEHGHSATLGYYPGMFMVFSTATGEFEDLRGYDAAGVLAVLEYGGDAVAMGKALSEAEGVRFDTGQAPGQTRERPPEPEATGRDPDALARCVLTFRTWLHLPDPGALYVSLATVAANRAPGDPVWALIVSPPGGGKTEVIQPLGVLPDVHQAATLTEAALLSGTSAKDRDKAAKGGLLRIIGDFGIILCKDFGSVLSMNRDSRAGLLAALREVYDGSWTRHVGTDGGRTLAWSGKVGFIGGCTPAIDSQHAVIGSMGERFILYRLPPVEAEQQVRRALGHVGKEQAMRQALGQAVTDVLTGLDAAQLVAPADAATTDRLVHISTLAVRCRSAVERDSYSREVLLIPEAEAPARLALVLLRLWNALRAIGCTERTAWAIVTKAALDSMPAIRRVVLEDLLARHAASTTTEVAERTRYPSTTTRRALEDLAAHGIVERQAQGPGRADMWQATTWTRGRWPTVPEMSEDMREAPGSVPENPGYMRAEHENEAQTVPITSPSRVGGGITGKVAADGPDLVDAARAAFGDDIEMSA